MTGWALATAVKIQPSLCMFKRKQVSQTSGDCCNPPLLPFKEGTKTVNIIC